ncbi:MAG: M23 family metallopeptidase [Acidimicrobiales bacterium]
MKSHFNRPHGHVATPRQRVLLALAGAVAAGLVAITALPATAQEPPPESTTTTTTVPPESTTTTTTAPPDPTTTTLPPGPDPGAGEVIQPEPVPAPDIIVPDPAGPYADQPPLADYAGRVVSIDVIQARAAALGAQAALASARAHRQNLEATVASLEARIRQGSERYLHTAQRLAEADLAMREQAVEAYVMGGIGERTLPAMLDSDQAIDLASRQAIVGGLLSTQRETIDDYRHARDAAADAQVDAAADLADARSRLEQARATETQAELMVTTTAYEVAVTSAGGTVVIHGFGFPVAGPHSFTDSFGAPRMTGTAYEHWHEGTDIFAEAGTPLVAVERGVVSRMGTAVLGGIVVWLKGASGTSYYFAHLSAFAAGVTPGLVVEAGTILGYVGNTGNARTTPPHLHFEIHPGGGPAINPYALLVVADSFDAVVPVAAAAPNAAAAPAPPALPTG